MEKQAELLAQSYTVTFIRWYPKKELMPSLKGGSKVNYINSVYSKSKNPLITYWNKKKTLKQALGTLENVDVIHAHVSFPDGWLFRYAKTQLRKPLVLTEHGSYYKIDREWTLRMKNEIYQTLKSANSIISVSSFLANDIKNRTGFKVAVIGNPIDTDHFKWKEKGQTNLIFYTYQP